MGTSVTLTRIFLIQMADAVDAPEKRSRDFQSNLGSVDANLERILWHLEDDCKKNA